MKKKILLIAVLIVLTKSMEAQNIHTLSPGSINGNPINFSQFTGNKIMVILIPFNRDDSVYKQLISFRDQYKDKISIIGIPSVEDGYKKTDDDSLREIYKNSGIIITEGMYTKKASGAGQSALMQWLTDNAKNKHFNNEADGVGSKFFISETGILYGALPPQVSLQSLIIEKAVNTAPK